MTSLSFMINIPSPGEKGYKQRAPINSMLTHRTIASNAAAVGANEEYIFPSASDLASVRSDDIAMTAPHAVPPPLSSSKEDMSLSARRLRSLRRQRLARDNRGESKEEVTYDYAFPAGSYILSMGSEGYDNRGGLDDDNNNASTMRYHDDSGSHATMEYSMMSGNMLHSKGQIRERQYEESKSNAEDDSVQVYYSRLEAAIQNFSTSIMESMSDGWCGRANGCDEDSSIIVDETSSNRNHPSNQEQRRQQQHPNDANTIEQPLDPFDIIQDPQVAAILKKTRNRHDAYGYVHASRPRDSRGDAGSYTSTDTHLRALEIVARNKTNNQNRNSKPRSTAAAV
ncbi:unnamed protein product [Cylindrotheca closterium]|uniref:Uncharacterized protein n=1 Tax=Cylindrotheca closterium TaxID=2856 RepID=A0AAD2CR04_9STRA|nr:unnamed protein product [Cylindrotheca closterium]